MALKTRTHVSAGTLILVAWVTLFVGVGRLVFSLARHWRSWQPVNHTSAAGLSSSAKWTQLAGVGGGVHGCELTQDDVVHWAGIGAGVLVFLTVSWMYWHWRGYWNTACDGAFETIDVDRSGSVDQAELEMGVVLVYGEINKYVRVARPNRAEIQKFLERFDVAKDGKLDRAEFRRCMFAMGPTVAFRTGTMLLVTVASPFLAHFVSDGISELVAMVYRLEFVVDLLKQQGLGPQGCTMAVASKALPFLNEDLANNFISLAIVMVLVPQLFDYYDAWGLTKVCNGQETQHGRPLLR
jgi:hypothetical protein